MKRLGRKARFLLEMFAAVGAETMAGALFPRSALMRAGGWDTERDLARRFQDLKDSGLLDFEDGGKSGTWIVRLTESGKSALRGDVEPTKYWDRDWDGIWRIVGFDLPARESRLRRRWHRWLKERRFGCLQHSLWIAPCFEKPWHDELASLHVDPSVASFLEARSFSKSSDRDFVKKAWDFKDLNGRYRELIEFLEDGAAWGGGIGSERWLRKEVELWKAAFDRDPFLPNQLLPKGYLGKRALAKRTETYLRIANP